MGCYGCILRTFSILLQILFIITWIMMLVAFTITLMAFLGKLKDSDNSDTWNDVSLVIGSSVLLIGGVFSFFYGMTGFCASAVTISMVKGFDD